MLTGGSPRARYDWANFKSTQDDHTLTEMKKAAQVMTLMTTLMTTMTTLTTRLLPLVEAAAAGGGGGGGGGGAGGVVMMRVVMMSQPPPLRPGALLLQPSPTDPITDPGTPPAVKPAQRPAAAVCQDGYLEKVAFLQRTDQRQAEVARSNRRKGMGLKD